MFRSYALPGEEPIRILNSGGERLINITIVNTGANPIELLESATATLGTGFPLISGAEYSAECSGSVALWAVGSGGLPGTCGVTRTVVERNPVRWAFKGPVDDATIARLPFAEAQELLRGAQETATATLATVEWHGAGPAGDPERTSFAMVDENGPLAHLVGERVVVKFRGKRIYAYVHRSADLDSAMSVTRILFMALAPLSTTHIDASVSIVL